MNKKNIQIIIRITVGLILLGLLVMWIGPGTMTDAITEFYPLHYAFALALLYGHILLQGQIIKTLLARHETLVRIRDIFRLSVIANFFGLFLPGAIGPDMVLCYNLVKSSDKKEVALSSIIFIRIAVLFIMAVLAFAASFHPLLAGTGTRVITGLVLLAFVFYFVLMANRNLLLMIEQKFVILTRHRITALLYKTFFALSQTGRDYPTILRITPALLGSAVVKVIVDYFIARSLGIEIPLLYFFALIPVITVIAAIPVTFAGLGVREASYVGLFGLAGVSRAESLAVAVISMTLVVVIAVTGALLYMIHGSELDTQQQATP